MPEPTYACILRWRQDPETQTLTIQLRPVTGGPVRVFVDVESLLLHLVGLLENRASGQALMDLPCSEENESRP